MIEKPFAQMNQHRKMRKSHGRVYKDRRSNRIRLRTSERNCTRRIHRRRRRRSQWVTKNHSRQQRGNRQDLQIHPRVSIDAKEVAVNQIDASNATPKVEALTRCAIKTWTTSFWFPINWPKKTRRVRAVIEERHRWHGRFLRRHLSRLGIIITTSTTCPVATIYVQCNIINGHAIHTDLAVVKICIIIHQPTHWQALATILTFTVRLHLSLVVVLIIIRVIRLAFDGLGLSFSVYCCDTSGLKFSFPNYSVKTIHQSVFGDYSRTKMHCSCKFKFFLNK